ncbi:hypothetical protein P6B95_15490 [Streptomyces atratus]|uniref:hypothetical protein n=1 Tax=Streptomyces atratus TaxID=1893 RepID=UPI0016704264|nr:hypothetical protein [Streptomyces atratus]WPW28651.1 hypothetical protein P6B95_15490 [Streptomyces atratus]GGT74540.1 hypothetical protein GCM10010207_84930 [Streptomyces atratus]
MARKSFALNKEPHIAEIGDDFVLEFQPEVMGDEYLDAYERLQDRYKNLGIEDGDLTGAAPGAAREAAAAVREFVSSLMMPDSAEQFAATPLPERIVVALLEWTQEIYGGGRPSGSSNGSATASPPPGGRGRATSRSGASTRTRGR